MTERSFDRAVGDWLESGSDRTPPAAIDAVLLAIKTTPQERDLRISRRFTKMPISLRLIAVAAIVVVVGAGVLASLGSNPGPGGSTAPGTPTPVATGTAVAPSAAPLPALEQAFSSTAFGYDAMYPVGWQATPGTTQGSPAELALGEPPPAPARFWDHFTPGADGPAGAALIATSTLLPPGTSEDAWVEAYQAPQVAQAGRGCIPLRSTWEPVTIDGHAGGIYVGCKFVEAVVFVDGRVYLFSYVNFAGPQTTVATTGRELLEALLGTVSLHPERVPDQSPEST
jgi:hypothetical protein